MFKTYADPKYGRIDAGKPVQLANSTVAATPTTRAGNLRNAATSGKKNVEVKNTQYKREAGGFSAERYNPAFDRMDEGSIVEDWIPRDAPGIHKMLRLIYLRDEVGGPMVDLYKEMMWSDYELHMGDTGDNKDKDNVLSVYEDSLESLDIQNYMPSLTCEVMVIGREVSTLLFDEKRGIFSGSIPRDPDFCVAGNTKIFTENGVVRIDSLGTGSLVFSICKENKMPPLSIDIASGTGISRTSRFGQTTKDYAVRLRTALGYEVRASDNHRVLVLDPEGLRLMWKQVKDIHRGDYLCIKAGTNLWPKVLFDCSGYFDLMKDCNRGNTYEWTEVPKRVTKTLGRLLGYLVGDGSIENRRFRFTNGNPEIVRDYIRCLKECFPDTRYSIERHDNAVSICVQTLHTVGFIRYLLGGAKTAGTKDVPDSIMRSPKKVVVEFLRGYLEADGSPKYNGGFTSTSKSKRLSSNVQLLLLNCGIVTKLRKLVGRLYDKEYGYYHEVNITKPEMGQLFSETVGFISSEKRNRYGPLLNVRDRDKVYDEIPGLNSRIVYIRKLLHSNRSIGNSSRHLPNMVKPRTMDLLHLLKMQNEIDLINLLKCNHITLSKVVEKKRSLHKVKLYDVTVPGDESLLSESFLANGIIVHNCKLTPMPIHGVDPLVDLRASPAWKEFVDNNQDQRIIDVRSTLPPKILEALSGTGFVELDPINTSIIRRRATTYDFIGCVVGNTLIDTKEYGLVPIKDIAKYGKAVECSDIEGAKRVVRFSTPISVRSHDGKESNAIATHWCYKGKQPTIGIRTNRGYTLRGTYDHPVMVWQENEAFPAWKPLKYVQKGDRVAICRTQQNWPAESPLLPKSQPSEELRGWTVVHTMPERGSYELGLVLGYLVSEGSIYVDKFSFANKNEEVIRDYISALRSVFPTISNITITVNKYGVKEVVVSSVHITEWFRRIGLNRVKAGKKEIPWVVLQGSEEMAEGFLSSCFEGDGCVRKDEVVLTSSSIRLLKQVQVLLLKFGIVASRSIHKSTRSVFPNGQEYCSKVGFLSAYSKEADLFMHLIGTRSKKNYRRWKGRPCRRPILDKLPITRAIEEVLSTRHRGRGWFTDDRGETVRTRVYYKSTRGISYENAPRIIEKVSKIDSKTGSRLLEEMNRGYFWDTVVTTKNTGNKRVYDIVVPETKAFVGNGIVQHNTSLFTRLINFLAIQKALLDSTVINLRRRAAGTLHIIAGNERWEPNDDDLSDLANMWLMAEEDAGGGVIVTRDGVQTERGQSAQGDTWKLSDEWSFLSEGKMRSLGVSDSFLSGESNFSTMELSLSVFLERIRACRDHLTDQFINRKIFCTLARAHGHIRPEKNTPYHRKAVAMMPYKKALALPPSRLILPEIKWHKSLHPVGDESYMSILDRMRDAGLPITLEHYAAAGGLNLKNAIDMTKDDIKNRDKLKEWKKKVAGDSGEMMGAEGGGGMGGGGGGGGVFGSARKHKKIQAKWVPHALQGLSKTRIKATAEKEMDKLGYWGASGKFCELTQQKAQKALQSVLPVLLRNEVPPIKTVLDKSGLRDNRERNAFRYILTRLGFVSGYDMSADSQKEITRHFAKSMPTKKAYKEIEILAKVCALPDNPTYTPKGVERITRLPTGVGGKYLLSGVPG